MIKLELYQIVWFRVHNFYHIVILMMESVVKKIWENHVISRLNTDALLMIKLIFKMFHIVYLKIIKHAYKITVKYVISQTE